MAVGCKALTIRLILMHFGRSNCALQSGPSLKVDWCCHERFCAMKLDRLYVSTAFVWLVLGMVFGIYVGISDKLAMANSHAHAILLGFVLSVLFGLIYRGWPSMQKSKLATLQYGIYQIGAVVLVLGKFSVDSGGKGVLAAPGSMITVLGTLLMAWIFLRSSDAESPADTQPNRHGT
jgi:peptidoglycan/LPS O-acetylase OafA/YrhL